MTKNNQVCIGKQFNYLKSLSASENKSFFEHSKLIKLKKDKIVFLENDRLKELYAICEGACKLTFLDDKGKEHITKIVGKGDIMGRHSVIRKKGALFTATAISDTLIYAIQKNIVLKNLEKNNNFCQDVLKGFIYDIEDDTETIAYFKNNRKLKIRLAGLLLYLSKKFGTEKKGWLKVAPKRKDMANILGTTNEYVISLLASFKDKNYISLKRDNIKINSKKELLIFINSK